MQRIEKLCEQAFIERDAECVRLKSEKRKERRKLASSSKVNQQAAPRQQQPSPYGQAHNKPRSPKYRLPTENDLYIIKLRSFCHFIIDNYEDEANANKLEFGQTKYVNTERALIHLLFAMGKHEKVHEAICKLDMPRVPKVWLQEYEDLWNHSSYSVISGNNLEQLNPVKRYRIRKRTPCPTRQITGKRKYRIDEKSSQLMNDLFLTTPKPTKEQKDEICRETGADFDQVTNWFKNKRQRIRRGSTEDGRSTVTSSTDQSIQSQDYYYNSNINSDNNCSSNSPSQEPSDWQATVKIEESSEVEINYIPVVEYNCHRAIKEQPYYNNEVVTSYHQVQYNNYNNYYQPPMNTPYEPSMYSNQYYADDYRNWSQQTLEDDPQPFATSGYYNNYQESPCYYHDQPDDSPLLSQASDDLTDGNGLRFNFPPQTTMS